MITTDKYILIRYGIWQLIVTDVNRLILEGWKPLGAPFYDGHMYCQAMTKDIKRPGED